MNAIARLAPEKSPVARGLSAEFLPLSEAGVLELAASLPPSWSGDEFAFDPQLFLASVSPRQWTPRVVVVRENDRPLGFVYTKERKVANVNTGVLYADGTLITPVLSTQADRADVLHTALHFLFSRHGARGLRLLMTPEGPDTTALRQALSALDVDVYCSDRTTYHKRLRLAPSYEEFLSGLGRKTRKNFRYYRRRFEFDGGHYVERLTIGQFAGAAPGLASKSHVPVKPETMQRFLRMLAAAPRPLLAGLRGPDGQWQAILGGWHGLQSTMIVLQLNNDCDYPRQSLSLVLRAYVIETLIAQGTQELVFWAGSSAPLAWYCSSIPAVAYYLDARTRPWRYFRYAAARIGSWFPKLANAAWIAPPRPVRAVVPDALSGQPSD